MVGANSKIRQCLVLVGVFAAGFICSIMYVLPSIQMECVRHVMKPHIVWMNNLLVDNSPAITFPPVKDIVRKANFSATWVEPPDLVNLRTFGVVENIPDDKILDGYNVSQLNAIYHSYLDNNDIICHRKLRMGNLGDGGWEICDDYEWRPIRPCIVYSFGINYDFSFDNDTGRMYGCDVYSFDPSMTRMNTSQRSNRVMFYSLGIGGQSGDHQIDKRRGWILHSLSNFRTMLNHTNKVIDVLKMDVEGAEWPSLANMFQERQLNDFRQLLIEFHQSSNDPNTVRSRLKIVRHLEMLGFRRFYVSKNFHCSMKAKSVPIVRTACYEVHYVNSNLVRSSS